MKLVIPKIENRPVSREEALSEFIEKRGMYDKYKNSTELVVSAEMAVLRLDVGDGHGINHGLVSKIYEHYCELFMKECIDPERKNFPADAQPWCMHEDFFTLAEYVFYIRRLVWLASQFMPAEKLFKGQYDKSINGVVNHTMRCMVRRTTKRDLTQSVRRGWKHAKVCHQILEEIDKQLMAKHH